MQVKCPYCKQQAKVFRPTEGQSTIQHCSRCSAALSIETTLDGTVILSRVKRQSAQSNAKDFDLSVFIYGVPITFQAKRIDNQSFDPIELPAEMDLHHLQKMLDDAIMNEEYEEAAKIRDRINSIKTEINGTGI